MSLGLPICKVGWLIMRDWVFDLWHVRIWQSPVWPGSRQGSRRGGRGMTSVASRGLGAVGGFHWE